METTAFNLLDEPWIRVMTHDRQIRELSLTQALLQSHEYRRLAGELPTQDVAILRLLLAVLHTVFYRVDLDGADDPIEERGQALARWRALRQAGRLPEGPIRAYLEHWHDRFWLFHPERPFYQVPGADVGTLYKASKLNGELSESSNKPRLFPVRAGVAKESLTYAEAARWLVYLNGFDDTSAKPKTKGLPSPGAGWMGKLGLIYVEGDTLFDTLLMNLTLLRDGRSLWDAPDPVWERDKPKSAERTEIAMPNDPAALLTMPSRRLLLAREGDRVTGYSLLGGDFFSKTNATAEQMTLWERRKGEKNEPDYDQPKRLDPDRLMWRDFSVIAANGSTGRRPGVIAWIATLKEKGVLPRGLVIRSCTAGVKYGDKDFFVADIVSDHLDFHAALLNEAGTLWNDLVGRKIGEIDKAAEQVALLAERLFKAGGGQPDSPAQDARKEQAKQDFYAAVDIPFRQWLYSLDPEQGDGEELRAEKDAQWREKAYRIALRQGRGMVDRAGTPAFVGRWVKKEGKKAKKDEKEFYASPIALDRFVFGIGKLFAIENRKKEGQTK